MAQIISFINYKGGVGKTTMSVEIAATLAQAGFGVLIVDLDPQTNASFYLVDEDKWEEWVGTHGSLKDIFEAAIGERDFDCSDVIMKVFDQRSLYLLPSHLDLLSIDLELAAKWGAQSSEAKMIIKDMLTPAVKKEKYDFVIVDCPPNLNLVTQNALMFSDSYIVVCLPEYFSVRGIGLIETQIGQMMDQVNANLRRFGADSVDGPQMSGIIFNRLRTRSGGTISQQNWMTQVRNQYGDIVFTNFVAETVRVAEASYRGPITFSDSKSDSQYRADLGVVAQEFFDKVVST